METAVVHTALKDRSGGLAAEMLCLYNVGKRGRVARGGATGWRKFFEAVRESPI